MRTPALILIALLGASGAGAASRPRAVHAQPLQKEAVEHLLSHVTFGPTDEERRHVEEVGLARYVDEQLDPGSIDDSAAEGRLTSLQTLRMSTPTIETRYAVPKFQPIREFLALPLCTVQPLESAGAPAAPSPGPKPVVIELQRAAFLRAAYSRRQLYERMVHFWENHFNIYVERSADRLLLTSFDRDTIRPFALGSFRALLGATAHSPAMLFYLDNWQSAAEHGGENGRPVRPLGGLNENYARELLELHTLGVNGGYTQKDVEEVARCFTGWTIYNVNTVGLFVFEPGRHDQGEKTVLGHRIPPGGGIADGEMVLDILARHPSTAHFIATKLARMFVSDDPPSSVVDRAAGVFLRTNGSIADTVRSILTSREFASQQSYKAKMKSPFEYAVSAVRLLGADSDGGPAMQYWIAQMGGPTFGRVTPDGYPDRAAAWLSSGTLIERMNFAVALANNRIAGTHYPAAKPAEVVLLVGSPQFQMR
jgi:uncharacterized protein (DUF1800 family)